MKSSIRRIYLEKRKLNRSLDNIISNTENNKDEKRNKNNKDKIKNVQTTENNKDKIKIKIVQTTENNKQINDHETNLKTIEMLQKELNEIFTENRVISKEKKELIREEKNQQVDLNKIMNDINKETKELNILKDIYAQKTAEYLQLRNQHREMMIRGFRQMHAATVSELNRHSLHRFFERLIHLSRMRNQNNGPLMTNEQIEALPLSYYPRNNDSNEKCVLCSFPFCYNDVIIRLRCNHIFHKACLSQTLTVNRIALCPTCGSSIL